MTEMYRFPAKPVSPPETGGEKRNEDDSPPMEESGDEQNQDRAAINKPSEGVSKTVPNE